MKYQIIKRSIFLYPIPRKNKKNGLVIRMKNKRSKFDGIRTDIKKGQQEYELLRYLRISQILRIEVNIK